MEKELNELIFRITGSQLIAVEEKFKDGEVKVKHIWPTELTTMIGNCTQMVGIEVELPDNTYWYREEIDGTKRIILKYFNMHPDIEYRGTVYSNTAVPNILFGFVIDPNGLIRSKKAICVIGERIDRESPTYQYPFSNVHANSQEICMGSNKFNKIDNISKLTSAPHFIMQLPNNDDIFKLENNTKELNYRDLLVMHSGKEKYDDSLLVPIGKKVKDYIELIKNYKY